MSAASSVLGATPALAVAKTQLRAQMKQRLAALSPTTVSDQSAAIFAAVTTFPPYVHARSVAVFLSMPATEVQTDAIVRHALAAGKQVFVPYLHAAPPALVRSLAATAPAAPLRPRVMDMVQLHDAADYAALARDRWGIPSVPAASVASRLRILGGEAGENVNGNGSKCENGTADASILDLILLPGVAFDVDAKARRIHRCGHGKGFYDYFLHRYALRHATTPAGGATLSRVVRLYGLALTDQVLPAGTVPTGPTDQPLDGLITGDGTIVVPEEQAQ